MSEKKDVGGGLDVWWEDRNLGEKIVLGIGFAILGLGLLALFGLVIMALWNVLMPDIFGLKRIGYWQAWGLFILSSILLKGWGGSSGESGSRSDRRRRRELKRYLRETEGEKDAAGEGDRPNAPSRQDS